MLRYLSKFLYVLPAKKSSLVLLLILFTFVSSLEVIGIGLIGPFISLASNPDAVIQQNDWIRWIYNQLGLTQASQMVALIGSVVILIFCFKSFMSWSIQSYIFKYSYIQRGRLVSKLMRSYLDAPYTFYLTKNSAHLIDHVVGETTKFANSVLSTLLSSTANLFTLIAISILLCIASPLAVVSLVFMVAPLVLLFNLFREKMQFWGKELYEANLGMIRSVNHGLGAFKETRVIGCGSYFEEDCGTQAERFANASIGFYAFKLSPRYISEAMLVIFLVGFTSVSLFLNQNMEELTSTLSIFALASIRLIPAFSNLASGLSSLKNSSYALNQLYSDLKELENIENDKNQELEDRSNLVQKLEHQQVIKEDKSFRFNHQVVLEQVTYSYPNASEIALEKISLTLEKGKSIAFIGKSGAGKTTLADVILGLLTPQSGDIQVDGQSIYSNLRLWQNLIGYIPQSIFLTDDTIERNIAFGVPDHLINSERLDKAIQGAQLKDVIDNLPDGVKTRVGERGVRLSGGQRQRVGIARALYHERDILVLDEATSALDNETESLVTEAIQSLSGSKTMIIIAHRLTTVQDCDWIYRMEKGKIIQSGSYREVILGHHANSSVTSD
ncbi:ABC transporter ATP-binding protein [Limnoraphis robusta Tam1]|uniref:ABC transporter ATP-binding protein n=1 Tax=Limnoraphis robusta CCNP1315 TaxID=3110306 RepID=A0ABU5TZ05_9CYAN|nr:ABC transporter ATP-binding protein [Limnoraphis robusta]MEA5497260.1 ABC transporter ATP-binding protein [Limnoraphis robusta BA-68 BA1]MEA5519678.1 ABC transporter ATP-binding protein [Limnoraphis robusta CCNP1315]MEA5540145.1 ABC transporter ATP-binding protein [Limnoraphis robusta Tam1]MEA5544828.1 ABC transporter ATP-binding protein [Limnoraphis robusta CCNP1324]